MPLYEIYNRFKEEDSILAGQPRHSRREILDELDKLKHADVLIVGGGVHGAAFARLAALNGLKTVLLEKSDYGGGASGVPLKLSGGWPQHRRFTACLDFKGMSARSELLYSAAHLVQPVKAEVLYPYHSLFADLGIRLCMGLQSVWRRLCTPHQSQQTHGPCQPEELFQVCKARGGKGVGYNEWIINGTRLVIEQILAARQEGALCLNHVQVVSFRMSSGVGMEVGWHDLLGGVKGELKCGVVINCAGGWVPQIGRLSPDKEAAGLKYFRIIYCLFDQAWPPQVLFLPVDGHRYCVVSPCQGRTFVAFMTGEIPSLQGLQSPLAEEVKDLLWILRRNLPESGLESKKLYYVWTGHETICVDAPTGRNLFSIGRKGWVYRNGVFSLLGGEYGTVYHTVYHGLRSVYRLSGVKDEISPLGERKLPGTGLLAESRAEFLQEAAKKGVPSHIIQRMLGLYGSRVRLMAGFDDPWKVLGNECLKGEVEMALELEQAESLEDVMCRRLQLAYQPGCGCQAVDSVLEIMTRLRPERDLLKERAAYQTKYGEMQRLLACL